MKVPSERYSNWCGARLDSRVALKKIFPFMFFNCMIQFQNCSHNQKVDRYIYSQKTKCSFYQFMDWRLQVYSQLKGLRCLLVSSPQNALLPAGLRQKDQTSKTATGPFDRERLLKYLEKEAMEHKDREDIVPFTGEKKGVCFSAAVHDRVPPFINWVILTWIFILWLVQTAQCQR